MLNSPRILGPVKIPTIIKGRSFDLLGKKVAIELPGIQPGYGMGVEFDDNEELRIGRKQILAAASRIYGSSRVQTASSENILYIWLKAQELEIAAQVKEHLMGVSHV
jgi:hypothetical protein